VDVEYIVELEAGLVAAGPFDGGCVPSGRAKVQINDFAFRKRIAALDQSPAHGDVSNPDRLSLVIMGLAVIDDSVPDERVTVCLAPPGARMVYTRFVVGPPLRIFEGNYGRVRKALSDDGAEQVVAGLFVAVDAGFVRELETDAIVLYPSYGAVELTVVFEQQSDMIPQLKLKIAADHCAAAGQIDKFDDDVRVFAAQDGLFG
jgi:hypothetical protein